MSSMRKLATLCLMTVLPLAAFADPIADGSFNPYKAGWYPNVIDGKPLACRQVCEIKAKAAAEFEAAPGPRVKRTFVCKVAFRQENRQSPFLYGNQFDARPACYTTDISLRGKYSERFLCLCVEPIKG